MSGELEKGLHMVDGIFTFFILFFLKYLNILNISCILSVFFFGLLVDFFNPIHTRLLMFKS